MKDDTNRILELAYFSTFGLKFVDSNHIKRPVTGRICIAILRSYPSEVGDIRLKFVFECQYCIKNYKFYAQTL